MHPPHFTTGHSAWQDSYLQHRLGQVPPLSHQPNPTSDGYSPAGLFAPGTSQHMIRDIIADGASLEVTPLARKRLRDRFGRFLIRLGERMVVSESPG